jgi:hypothetical protein
MIYLVQEEIKKEDKKTVFEKKQLSPAEVKKIITDKLSKGANVLKVRKELLDQKVPYDLINDALLEFAKETQDKTVENLKKKGTFSPEMSSEQIKEMRKKEISSTKAAAPAKGDAGKKKK